MARTFIERAMYWRGWRIVGWGMAAFLLLLPFVAMQFTDAVDWSAGDFIFAGVMFAIVGGVLEVAVHSSDRIAYRLGTGIALLAGFLLVWINGAVGIIGDEGNPANLMFGGVLLVAIAGAVGAGARAAGLARAMAAAALAQLVVGVVAYGADRAVLPVTVVFVLMWGAAALLFRSVAADQ
ncbi:hypothetical protein ATM17_17965 [Sphingopyxis macrogoltabida]|uniref:Uncharacterized protein n=2 Tax=Sphingopyxis macrogoltabida TaxID=33050 RepID=A0AAC8Z2Z7_SPHMC|nr:hypothetical protein ATM17_17965 [Sphingopyxis macrogoltabida]